MIFNCVMCWLTLRMLSKEMKTLFLFVYLIFRFCFQNCSLLFWSFIIDFFFYFLFFLFIFFIFTILLFYFFCPKDIASSWESLRVAGGLSTLLLDEELFVLLLLSLIYDSALCDLKSLFVYYYWLLIIDYYY